MIKINGLLGLLMMGWNLFLRLQLRPSWKLYGTKTLLGHFNKQ